MKSKILIICTLLLSLLTGCSNNDEDTYVKDKKIARFLTEDFFEFKGYENFAICDTHKLAIKMKELKKKKLWSYDVEIPALRDIYKGIKNNDFVKVRLELIKKSDGPKENRNIYYYEKKIPIKNLKKLPTRIDVSKNQATLQKLFNENFVKGVDGQGKIESLEYKHLIIPNNYDFIQNYFNIIRFNGEEYHPEMGDGNLKNGDTITLGLNRIILNNLERKGIIVDNPLVDIKVTNLLNNHNFKLADDVVPYLNKNIKIKVDISDDDSKQKDTKIPAKLESLYLSCDPNMSIDINDSGDVDTNDLFLIYSIDKNKNGKKGYYFYRPKNIECLISNKNFIIKLEKNNIKEEQTVDKSYFEDSIEKTLKERNFEYSSSSKAGYMNIWNVDNQPLKDIVLYK